MASPQHLGVALALGHALENTMGKSRRDHFTLVVQGLIKFLKALGSKQAGQYQSDHQHR